MKIRTDAYDLYGNYLPEEEYYFIASFSCNIRNCTIGVWVSPKSKNIELAHPIFLTRDQIDKLPELWQKLPQHAAMP